MEEQDKDAIEKTAGHARVITSPPDDYSSAVQNWNSAAERADGDLLFVISDDLTPVANWDNELVELCQGLDPVLVDFCVKIKDSPSYEDTTLRHPVVSRKFYNTHGLFDDKFRGVYCDNDITMRAFLFSQILDGRSLAFHHSHPHFERSVTESVSQKKINAPREYNRGSEMFRSKYFPLDRGLNLNRLSLPTPSRGHFFQRAIRALLLSLLRGKI